MIKNSQNCDSGTGENGFKKGERVGVQKAKLDQTLVAVLCTQTRRDTQNPHPSIPSHYWLLRPTVFFNFLILSRPVSCHESGKPWRQGSHHTFSMRTHGNSRKTFPPPSPLSLFSDSSIPSPDSVPFPESISPMQLLCRAAQPDLISGRT